MQIALNCFPFSVVTEYYTIHFNVGGGELEETIFG